MMLPVIWDSLNLEVHIGKGEKIWITKMIHNEVSGSWVGIVMEDHYYPVPFLCILGVTYYNAILDVIVK